jgi:formylglycine-generating enzyme required for sulfatase activity
MIMRQIATVVVTAALAAAPARHVDPLTGMSFVLLPAGTFTMGSPATEVGREPQERQHRVTIGRAFYLGVYEVTQAEWKTVMSSSPSAFAGCERCPVERVSYLDIERFLEHLNARSPWPGFRLPTEAEWEYACRAGGPSAYGATDAIDAAKANIRGRRTRPVGSYAANAWGLFDMSGNVWEWTSTSYRPYAGARAPDGPAYVADRKVIRGGSWLFDADSARCALRYTHRPQDSGPSLGFRLAHDVADPAQRPTRR